MPDVNKSRKRIKIAEIRFLSSVAGYRMVDHKHKTYIYRRTGNNIYQQNNNIK
jgi:hypothetical protein